MLNAINTIVAASGVAQRTKAAIRRRVIAVAIAAVGAAFICTAIGFIVAAAYFWLSITLPNYMAALCVAGALFAVGIVVLVIANRRPHPTAVARNDVSDVSDVAGDALTSVATYARQHPTATLLSALALGVAVGLLRKDSSRQPIPD